MKNRELVHMMLKMRAAADYALKTPELLLDYKAVEGLRDALPVPVQPARTNLRELTTLVSEGE